MFVREKPTIRDINYKGLSSVSVSDVLDRFKKEKVPLSVDSQYDPTKIKHAETVIKELLAEHGHQFATIKTEVKTIPPASVQVNFNVKEGPVVKVGRIHFVGNTHISGLELRRAMKNLKPIGIPYSIIFEDLFPQTYDSSKLEEDTERVRQAYRDKGYANAAVEQPKTQIRDQGGLNWFTFRPNKGKRIDIQMTIEEGGRYRLGAITFTGNKQITNLKALRATFPIKDGDWFNATDSRQGPGQSEKGLRRPRLHQLRRHPQAHHRRAEENGVDEHRHRRGQAVLRLAHRVPGQHRHPRQASFAASSCSMRARSTTPSFGSTACSALTSWNTSSR